MSYDYFDSEADILTNNIRCSTSGNVFVPPRFWSDWDAAKTAEADVLEASEELAAERKTKRAEAAAAAQKKIYDADRFKRRRVS